MQTAGISGGEWGSLTDNFSTEYRYDYNGNILSLQRKDANAQIMHHINYTYNAKNNRLQGITAVGINSSTYGYDAIGNLANDSGENVGVTWNAMNKVKTVVTPNSTLHFAYSPTGQRQIKKTGDKTEYYLHDATGNIMCIYELNSNYLTVKERTIYGSKRIGVYRQRIRFGISSSFIQVPGTGLINILHPQPVISPDGRHYLEGSNRLQVIGANQRIVSNTTMPYSYKKGTAELKGLSPLMATRPTFLDGTKTAGLRDYELTDHLSNVMAVISDRKLSVDTNNDTITDYYSPQVVSFTDYYPFGFPMAERSGNLSGYRFGFNGQEADGEIYGVKTSYAFEARLYNSILGRWFSPDLLSFKYPSLGSYTFTANNPIRFVDINGKDFVVSIDNSGENKTITIKQTFYAMTEEDEKYLRAAVNELNNITQTVTINDVEYTLTFEINVAKSDPNRNNAHPSILESQLVAYNAQRKFKEDKSGEANIFYSIFSENEESPGKYIGGEAGGYMARTYLLPDNVKVAALPQLVVHEVLHLLGLTDEGGAYYDPNGRMAYRATNLNNYYMNPISNQDIINILRYAFDFEKQDDESNKVKVKFEYTRGSNQIEDEPSIK